MSAPFLTALDSRAAVKGSVDPLGLRPIWIHYGRQAVGNLTTVSTALRNFTTLLIGLRVADRLIDQGRAHEAERANLFMRVEQLCAYARFWELGRAEAGRILGVTRVTKRIEGDAPLYLSGSREHQILSNQLTYGIWGLYSVAARTSGLLDQEEQRPTPDVAAFVDREYLQRIDRGASSLESLIAHDGRLYLDGRHKEVVARLGKVLGREVRSTEKELLTETLARNASSADDSSRGVQDQLWATYRELYGDDVYGWSAPMELEHLEELRRHASRHHRADLAEVLRRIGVVEPLLAPADRLFAFVLQRAGATVADVAEEVAETWGDGGLRHLNLKALTELQGGIAEAVGSPAAEALLLLADQLRGGDYEAAIQNTLALNEAVMKARGGAPWAVLRDGNLEIRLKPEMARLPPAEVLPFFMRNPYFLDSVRSVTADLEGIERVTMRAA